MERANLLKFTVNHVLRGQRANSVRRKINHLVTGKCFCSFQEFNFAIRLTASERKKQYKRSRVFVTRDMGMMWKTQKSETNCRLLAVNDKNYASNRRFFSRNLFMWQHLDTSSTCLFSKLFLSACKIVTFSARQSWHVLELILIGWHTFYKGPLH